MKHYNSIPNIKEDKSLIGENICAFNKLDGQNFCVRYSAKNKCFNMFGSRTQNVDETSEQFGEAVTFFKQNIADKLLPIILENSGKKGLFNGINEITFFFEWYGDNSFAGFHQKGDNLRLSLIDVFLKKKGYIEPKDFISIFVNSNIETPDVIYQGKLDRVFITTIQNNVYTDEGCLFPNVKEGVVCKRSTRLQGQYLPMVKIKTKWWIDKLHNNFTEDECKKLE